MGDEKGGNEKFSAFRIRCKDVLEVLEKGGCWNAKALSDATGLDVKFISRTVRAIRMKFLDGEDFPYIYTAEDGYTLDRKSVV